jgi:hypothetical protein
MNSLPDTLLTYTGYTIVDFLIKFCKKYIFSYHIQFRSERATTHKFTAYAVGCDLQCEDRAMYTSSGDDV